MTPQELTRRREALGLSRAQLAAWLGLTRQIVYKWEAGQAATKRWLTLVLDRIEQLQRQESEKCTDPPATSLDQNGSATSMNVTASDKPKPATASMTISLPADLTQRFPLPKSRHP